MNQNPIGIPGERKFDPEYQRKPSGHIIVDGQEVAQTLQCCHCGTHYIPIIGSGIKRGYCMRCKKTTCGNSLCDVCVPHEMKLRWIEANAWVQEELLSGEKMPQHEWDSNQKTILKLLADYPELSKIQLKVREQPLS